MFLFLKRQIKSFYEESESLLTVINRSGDFRANEYEKAKEGRPGHGPNGIRTGEEIVRKLTPSIRREADRILL